MPQNAEKFLDVFNHIEKYLKTKYNNGTYLPFHDLIRKAAGKESIIKLYRKDLYFYADLRNVMVHNSRINGRIIVEPLNEVLENIEKIWSQIQHPEKVSMFKKKVFYCFTDDKLSKALEFIRVNKISQVPILEKGKIIDVLNGTHIAGWLAAKDIVSPAETEIREVLQMAERSGNFEIISGDMSVFDAAEIYKNSYMKAPTNWYYDALIITPTGKADDQMNGIIVLKDIAEYIST
jgi:predicted transcriptional regulator